jgi:TetR/AcrR family transcriptional regulator, biofilm operon repressor
MERKTTEKKLQVKEKIGAAAMQCFERYGLDRTTLDDIGRTVGLNKASLYYYYKNKEDIFLDVAIKEGETFIENLQQKTLQKKGVEKQVMFYLQERIGNYRQVLNMHKVGAETLNRILPTFFVLYDEVLQNEKIFIAQLLKQGIKDGEIKKADVQKLSAALIGITDAVKQKQEQQSLMQGLSDVDYTEAVQHVKCVVQLMFAGLKQ